MNIIYEDKDIVVVAKQAGVPVHPSPGFEKGTMTDDLVRLYPEMRNVGSRERPGVVHRLDIETSGIMVFARNQQSYTRLREMFERHDRIRKVYLAVVHGAPKKSHGTLETLLAKRADKKRMKVVPSGGQLAITHWEVLQKSKGISIVEFVIETGRTHQIRVHAAYLGHPIVGDKLYGDHDKDARIGARRLLLHAVQLSFPHPINGKPMEFAVEPPDDIIYPL